MSPEETGKQKENAVYPEVFRMKLQNKVHPSTKLVFRIEKIMEHKSQMEIFQTGVL